MIKHHILVIDDEQEICDLLNYVLTPEGFQVTTTTRGADALLLLEKSPVHLVILDVMLKDGNGLELLSKIRKAHPQLPVLMLTGLGFKEGILQEAQRRGVSAFLTKTLTTAHLLPQIRRLLNPPAG